MKVILTDGTEKVCSPFGAGVTGYSAKSIQLDEKDIAQLAGLSKSGLYAVIQQLNGRCNRATTLRSGKERG